MPGITTLSIDVGFDIRELYIFDERCLRSEVYFDMNKYNALKTDQDKQEFVISLVIAGIEKASKSYDLPVDEIMGFIEEFRQGGYKNTWRSKKIKL